MTSIPRWMRIVVRIDFVLAVVLTVIAPLALLVRAMQTDRPQQLRTLIRYWRTSSLLMVSVYLLIGERRSAFICGVGARLLLARLLLRTPVPTESRWFGRWQTISSGYCLAGATLTLPMLAGVVTDDLPLVCRAYIEPAQQFGALLHPSIDRDTLGQVGEYGLVAFLGSATLLQLLETAFPHSAIGARLSRS